MITNLFCVVVGVLIGHFFHSQTEAMIVKVVTWFQGLGK